MVREPLHGGGLSMGRRGVAADGVVTPAAAATAGLGSGALSGTAMWNDAFNRAALELIALTATTQAAARTDRVAKVGRHTF